MTEQEKRNWINALRSGEYTQGKASLFPKSLNEPKTACCIAVFCMANGISPEETQKRGYAVLVNKSKFGGDASETYWQKNDACNSDERQWTFAEIADFIEKEE